MLMNENSELRSLLRLSKNFLKNIINKSIKNNIVLINNDGGVKTKRRCRGFIPSTFGVTLSYIKFYFIIKKFILIIFITISKSLTLSYIFSFMLICISSFTLFCISSLVVTRSFIHILIQIFSISLINISFSSSFISFICISFISFIISSIFTSFTGLFISDNTVITI